MDELQDLEPPLLGGSTNTRTYRELARLHRELNPFERSLVHIAEFAAAVAGARPRVQGAWASYPRSRQRLRPALKRWWMLHDRTCWLIQTYRDNVNTQLNLAMRRLAVLSAMSCRSRHHGLSTA